MTDARCLGLRDALMTLRPLPMCCECARWQESDTDNPRTVQPHAVVQIDGAGLVLHCSRRVPAPPLAEV